MSADLEPPHAVGPANHAEIERKRPIQRSSLILKWKPGVAGSLRPSYPTPPAFLLSWVRLVSIREKYMLRCGGVADYCKDTILDSGLCIPPTRSPFIPPLVTMVR